MTKKKQKHLTPNEIKRKHKFMALLNDMNEKMKNIQDVDFEAPIGKRVRIRHDDYDMRILKGELSAKFIEWYQTNKNNEFIVKGLARNTSYSMYELEDVENWIFNYSDLIEVNDE